MNCVVFDSGKSTKGYAGSWTTVEVPPRSGTRLRQPLIWTIFWYVAFIRTAIQVLRLHTDLSGGCMSFFSALFFKNFAIIHFGEWMRAWQKVVAAWLVPCTCLRA